MSMQKLILIFTLFAITLLVVGCSTDTSPGEITKLNNEMTSKPGETAPASGESLPTMSPPGGKTSEREKAKGGN